MLNRILVIVFLLSYFTSVAQPSHTSIEKNISSIKYNVKCCSDVFPGSKKKVTSLIAFSGGEMTFVYNDGLPPLSFNFFELYKTVDTPLGFSYKEGTSVIVFKLSEYRSEALRFQSVKKAKETYGQFKQLYKKDKENYKPSFLLTVEQTVDSINSILNANNTGRATVQLVSRNIFKISQMPSIRYDIDVLKLKSGIDEKYLQVRGITHLPEVTDGYGKGARIKFQYGNETLGFLKFEFMSNEDIALIYRLFIHLGDEIRDRLD